MGIARGPNTVKDGLVFGYDTGYGVADNSTATRFYPGEATTNFVTTNLETLGTDGSGQSSIGTRTTIAPNHVRIVDVASNTRQSHLISGLTASTIYTVSIQFKKITGTPTFRFQLQGYSGSSYVNTIKFTSTAETGLEDIEGWQTAEWTFTLPSNCNALRIWWQDGADYTTYTHSFELKNPQLEAKSHVTPYVSGTRSSTASLIDLKRTTNIDVSNISFDSTGQPTFDGSDDYISIDVDSWIRSVNSVTIEGVVIIPSGVSLTGGPWSILTDHSTDSDKDGFWWHMNLGGYTYFRVEDAVSGEQGITFTGASVAAAGNTYHIVTIVGLNSVKIYVNGVLSKSYTPTFNWANVSASHTASLFIGRTYPSYWLNSTNPVVKVYDVALTEAEIKQNYNSYKNRFDI